MRKRIAFTLTMIMIVMLFPPSAFAIGPDDSSGADSPAERPSGTHTVESGEYPLYFFGPAETGKSLKLYFVDGAADLPYIEANDLPFLMKWLAVDCTETTGYDLNVETEGRLAVYTRENDYTMVVDFERDTIEFTDYNMFIAYPDQDNVIKIVSLRGVNAEGELSLLKKTDYSLDRYGDIKTLSLADYGIDLIAQDGLFLIPLHTISDFLTAPMFNCSCFFNRQCLILTGEINENVEALYYAAPTGERSEALAKYGYAELCLMMDSLYGLKENHRIDSFDRYFSNIAYDTLLAGDSVKKADNALYHLINLYFDDLHSYFGGGFSYLNGRHPDYVLPVGDSMQRWRDSTDKYRRVRSAAYPDGVPGYEEVGNTAYITFDLFMGLTEDAEDYYDAEFRAQALPADTIALIIYAHEQINREDSPIENVVIDLSCNTGGMVDAAVFVMSWFLGEAFMSLEDSFTGATTTVKYMADVNLDRRLDEQDTVSDKNLFCLTSPVSFSSGNTLPCAFKQSGRVTLLGRPTGGGTSMILDTATAWGTSFKMSGNMKESFLKNGSFFDNDKGVDPDFVITSPEMFYDRAALTDYINSLYGVTKTAAAANAESAVLPDAAEDGAPTVVNPQAVLHMTQFGKRASSMPVA